MDADPVSAPRAVELPWVGARSSEGRDQQFEAFVADVGPYLLRVALLLCGDRVHADDPCASEDGCGTSRR